MMISLQRRICDRNQKYFEKRELSMSSGPEIRIILVTRTGCPGCEIFLKTAWPKYRERFASAVGIPAAENIDIAKRGVEALPAAVRSQLEFVPQLFAVYADGSAEHLSRATTESARNLELEKWATVGPPKWAATHHQASIVQRSDIETESQEQEDDYLDDPTLVVVAVTSTQCHHCSVWEASGNLQKFLDAVPAGTKREHFTINPSSQPKSDDERHVRSLFTGFGIPAAIVVNYSKWKNPKNLTQRDIFLCPGLPNTPQGAELFQRWFKTMTDPKVPFIGYLILTTSDRCGHCVAWKKNGGMQKFLDNNKSYPGLLLTHNGTLTTTLPRAIESTIRAVPTLIFVAALEWNSPKPEIINGPQPQNADLVAKWVSQILNSEARWSGASDQLPEDYTIAAMERAPRSLPGTGSLTVKRQPHRRQLIR